MTTPRTSHSRRRSRILAFHVLFEADLRQEPVADVARRQFAESSLAAEALEFAQYLLNGVREHLAEIDDAIRQFAPAFPLEDLSPVDRNVLRLAIYEVLFDTRRAPLRVAINEAVDIAKGYGSESSGRFVNGVLGAIALEAARQHEIMGSDEDPHPSGDSEGT
ncbi:MAG: transcription antitermination factor NusB [Chloroflexi bacterium]|nr:transcription antitermination factor NusB [Chloroflexota bacterium]MQC48138.1 transcription antitermination factor NusB [Chloroflexota bacterium]